MLLRRWIVVLGVFLGGILGLVVAPAPSSLAIVGKDKEEIDEIGFSCQDILNNTVPMLPEARLNPIYEFTYNLCLSEFVLMYKMSKEKRSLVKGKILEKLRAVRGLSRALLAVMQYGFYLFEKDEEFVEKFTALETQDSGETGKDEEFRTYIESTEDQREDKKKREFGIPTRSTREYVPGEVY